MTEALSPAQAVAYVRELSADVRAVAVLDAAGARLAGPPAFAAAAADLVGAWPAATSPHVASPPPAAPQAAAAPPPPAAQQPPGAAGRDTRTVPEELVARVDGGVVFAARADGHAIVAAAGPLSLLGPTSLDVRAALAALTDAPTAADAAPAEPTQPADPALRRAIAALLTVA